MRTWHDILLMRHPITLELDHNHSLTNDLLKHTFSMLKYVHI